MKAKMLKLAGVKSEKEFYSKFPTEEAFMKVHGKEFKKAKIGSYISNDPMSNFKPIGLQSFIDKSDYAVTGSTQAMRDKEAMAQAQLAAQQKKGGGDMLSGITNILSSEDGMKTLSSIAGAKKGKSIKKAQNGYVPQRVGQQIGQSANDYINSFREFESTSGMTFPSAKKSGSPNGLEKAAKLAAPGIDQVIQGIDLIKQQKNALNSARQMEELSDLTLQASRLRPEQQERRYLRPEDNINTGEAFFPIYGVGTNPLAKNGTEIANTFAPNTIYDDLGYEPLYDSERVKQFFTGGKMRKAAEGDWLAGTDIYKWSEQGLGDKASSAMSSTMGESAGSKIGGGIGKAAGTAIGGPVGGMIGQVGGQLIGGLIDRSPQKIKKAQDATNRNIMASGLNQGFRSAQQQYTSFMEDGGNVNPQIISKFGNYSLEDLLAADPTMDTLRAGGHLKEYTAPTAEAMSTERPMLEQGGELDIHWGGDAESVSYNPFLPDSGETIMFRGQSHDESDGQGNTGIGITYGQSPVEVERGEPAVKLQDGGNSESLVVFGNLKVPNSFVPILGEEAKGKKFKNYVADLSKKENKQNKIIDKASEGLENLDMNSPFDKLTLGSYKANIMGANMKLKDIAQKKMDAGELQNAMNTMMEYEGFEAGDDGIIKAKKGAKIPKADIGANLPPVSDNDYRYLRNLYEAGLKGKKADKQKFQKEYHRIAKPYAEEILAKEKPTQYAKDKGYSNIDIRGNEEGLYGPRTDAYMAALKTGYNRGMGQIQTVPTGSTEIKAPTTLTRTKASDLKPATKATTADNNKFDWMNLVNQTLPYLRPTDAERLDANQLAGEMFALSQNQLEPVQAQLFQPELNVPYDISLQDILNENQADFRSQQRMVGYNPAAQGMLNAQKYAANQKVLGEQFRMNQAQKQQVYNENRALLNQARLQNLGILDTQYQRQAAAKSATKATTQAALNSIADKYAKNKLEGRTLQAYENLYNYRFDPAMRTQNMNPLVDWKSMIANASTDQLTDLSKQIEERTKGSKKETKSSRNGSIVKALKNL
jgi:hypothetical protein